MKKIDNQVFKGLIAGIFIGGMSTALCLVGVVEKALDTYADMYNYDETVAIDKDWDQIDSKRELLIDFMDRHSIFGLREDATYESMIFQSALDLYDDDYAVYYNKEQTEDFVDSRKQQYEGIGITVTKNGSTNSLTIIDVAENGPAWEAGLRTGDVCYKINDTIVTKMTASEMSELIESISVDTPLKFTVKRLGETITIEVKRQVIDYDYVDYELIDNEIPYIKLKQFNGDSAGQVKTALENMKSQIDNSGVLIIDLRNNSGGAVEQAQSIAGYFVGNDKLLTYIIKKSGEQERYKTDTDKIVDKDTEIIILTNGTTASASELFICAIQDYGCKTYIIGDTTFGKGIAQKFELLLDGSAIKYTEGFYYSPDGRNIHNKGIEPDLLELDSSKQFDLAVEKAREVIN